MKRRTSHKITVVSSNKADTPLDIEEKLQKAVATMKEQQESREIPDLFLKTQHQAAAKIVDQVLESMLSEIAEVLNGGENET